jgi:hypothetical protein
MAAALTDDYEQFLAAVFDYLSISAKVTQLTAEYEKDPFAFFVKDVAFQQAKQYKADALAAVHQAKTKLQVPPIDKVCADLRNWLDKQQNDLRENAAHISEFQFTELQISELQL